MGGSWFWNLGPLGQSHRALLHIWHCTPYHTYGTAHMTLHTISLRQLCTTCSSPVSTTNSLNQDNLGYNCSLSFDTSDTEYTRSDTQHNLEQLQSAAKWTPLQTFNPCWCDNLGQVQLQYDTLHQFIAVMIHNDIMLHWLWWYTLWYVCTYMILLLSDNTVALTTRIHLVTRLHLDNTVVVRWYTQMMLLHWLWWYTLWHVCTQMILLLSDNILR